MSKKDTAGFDRRDVLKHIVTVAGSAPLASGGTGATAVAAAAMAVQAAPASAQAGAVTAAPSTEPAAGYQFFGPDEAGFIEAFVNVMCPADHLTPNGVDCGLAIFIDRQLAGGYGQGENLYMLGPWQQGKPQLGYQLPLTPAQFFRAGIAAANAACRARSGKNFEALTSDAADLFLSDLAAGKVTDARLPLGEWFNELAYPLFVQACFADPIYGGNHGKVFWRMVGYPGLPATHAHDMVEFRGKPFPLAKAPKSIADFS